MLTTVLELVALVFLAAAAGLGAYDLLGAPAGLLAIAVVLLIASWVLNGAPRPRRKGRA